MNQQPIELTLIEAIEPDCGSILIGVISGLLMCIGFTIGLTIVGMGALMVLMDVLYL